jgi:hypothetical protein
MRTLSSTIKLAILAAGLYHYSCLQVQSQVSLEQKKTILPIDRIAKDYLLSAPLPDTSKTDKGPVSLKDSVFSYVWDTITGTWANFEKDVYQYTHKGKISEHLVCQWEPATSSWVNSQRYTYEYTNHEITEIVFEQIWDRRSKAWIN